MERRTALALAVAAAGTALASSAAFAINVGLLRHDVDKPVGVLDTSVIDASFGTDPTQVTVAVDRSPAGVGSPGPSTEANQPDAASAWDDDATAEDHLSADDHGSDDHPASATVPGHDDDD